MSLATGEISLDLPAPPHSRFTGEAAASLVGQEFNLDGPLAGVTGMVAFSLSMVTLTADTRGVWVRAKIVSAEVVRDGTIIRVGVEVVPGG